ncbi:GNAT family N-acetyltransferase [Paraglaciecola sp.]|uniref:GNAT family N-acetyltransferase n=1 Tax=Paraglaciecola sp. TaxID=1920173 RepID=UPI0030F3E8BE
MDIRLVTRDDAERLAEYYRSNSSHFCRWEPIREREYYSEASLQVRLSDHEQLQRSGNAAYFIGFYNNNLIAHCSLTNIVYGPFRACNMGYGVDKKWEGTGTMSKICAAAIEYAFAQLELNRIMANYMRCNERSANLLKKLGFSEEGLAKKYLNINGRWEDHVLTSLVNPANLEYPLHS